MSDDPIRHFTTSDGLRLAYSDIGTGTPVLCLAGLTRNMADFETVLNFADRVRLIRLDSRGRGQSDHAADWRSYSIPQEAVDAVALLDHLGIGKAAILGTSRGGLIAMTLAATQKHRLAGAMLNDIGPVIEETGLTAIMGYLGNRPGFRDFADAGAQLALQKAGQFPGVSADEWERHARRIWWQAEDGLDLRYDPHLRDAMLAAAESGEPVPDLWPLFAALDGLPVALLRGARSDLLSAETAARMAETLPGLAVTEVPDRGHVPFLDEPESQAAIAAFLDRLT